jgi:hypothetical protein
MTVYSTIFNTMCIYFMVTTAPAVKLSRRPWVSMAAGFVIVLTGNAMLLEFPIAEAVLRGSAIGAVFVVIYWVLIRSAKSDE